MLMVALVISIISPNGRPEREPGRAWVSAALPGTLLASVAPDIKPDAPLIGAIESSNAPGPTPTAPPATPSPSPVVSPTPAPTAAPAPPPPPPTAAPTSAPTPVPPPPPPPPPPPGSLTFELAGRLLDSINAERAAVDLPQLAVNGALTAAAEDYAAYHFLNADPFQLRHDLDGGLMDRLRRHGYTGGGGEALVSGPPDAQVLLSTWLNSSGHRDILLSAQYVHIGVGCYRGPYADQSGNTYDVALCVADLGYP